MGNIDAVYDFLCLSDADLLSVEKHSASFWEIDEILNRICASIEQILSTLFVGLVATHDYHMHAR